MKEKLSGKSLQNSDCINKIEQQKKQNKMDKSEMAENIKIDISFLFSN